MNIRRVDARTFFWAATRSWKLFLLVIVGSVLASIVVVRSIQPQYEAKTKILSSEDAASQSPLSLIPGAASILGERSNLAELEAVVSSRRLADQLAKDPSIREKIARQFASRPPDTVGKLRRFVATTIFGVPRGSGENMAENIQRSLENDLVIDVRGSIADVSYIGPDREVAAALLQGTLDHGQLMVKERRRANAVEYQNYILSLIRQNANGRVDTLRVLSSIVPGAIAQAARLSSPSSTVFEQIDSINVSGSPVRPRIGLVVAVCLAVGLGAFAIIIYWRRT